MFKAIIENTLLFLVVALLVANIYTDIAYIPEHAHINQQHDYLHTTEKMTADHASIELFIQTEAQKHNGDIYATLCSLLDYKHRACSRP